MNSVFKIESINALNKTFNINQLNIAHYLHNKKLHFTPFHSLYISKLRKIVNRF